MKKILLSIIFVSLVGFGFSQSVTTNAATAVTQTSATLNASGTSLNSSKNYRVDFYYDVVSGGTSNVISSNTFTGATSGSFTAVITGLNSNTDYYFTAYLYEYNTPPPQWVYKAGGTELSFHTLATTAPSVTIGPSITGVTKTIAYCNNNSVTNNGGDAITAYGLCWSTSANPTVSGSHYEAGTSGTPPINYNGGASSLSPGTKYYMRAYATNSIGTGYSSEDNFITNTDDPILLGSASGVKSNEFQADWNLTTGAQGYRLDVATDNGFTSMVSGYNNLDVGDVDHKVVTGLTANTTYYYRIRAYHDGGDNGANFTSGNSGTNSVTTLVDAPTLQVSNMKWETVNAGKDMAFNWTPGNGAATIFVMKDGSSVQDPTGGNTYTANANFGDGDNIDFTGTYVVYNSTHAKGSTTNLTVTGLTSGHTYYFKGMDYNGSGSTTNYNTTAATGYNSGNSGTTGLPISLLSFNASEQDGNVAINWETATEINNDYFIIERSLDAENFTPIGKIQGAGNSNVIQKYNFIDTEAPKNTVIYYRLHQYDFDGKDEIFPSVSLTLKESNIGIKTMSLVGNSLVINYSNPNGDNTVIQLVDINGKSVQMALSSAEGKQKVSFDLSGLSHGLYFVSFEQENTTTTRKFVY